MSIDCLVTEWQIGELYFVINPLLIEKSPYDIHIHVKLPKNLILMSWLACSQSQLTDRISGVVFKVFARISD